MRLYHFTAGENLRAIDQYGLTVGDVPTDISKFQGIVGVWFTTAESSDAHGLEGSALNKKRYRIAVDLDDSPPLYKWTDWAPRHVRPATIDILHKVASGWDTWHIYLGWVKRERIVSVRDMENGCDVDDWPRAWPEEGSRKGTPFWRRDKWLRHTLRQIRRHTVER